MGEFLQHLVDEPIANMIALTGLALLFVAAVGKITGTVEPDARGRIVSGILGLILVPGGLVLHRFQDSNSGLPPQPGPITVWLRLRLPGHPREIRPSLSATDASQATSGVLPCPVIMFAER
jgi:hypothetical protein